MDSSAFPHILVFSEGCISQSHGTGAIFLRNFAGYPADRLSNAFIGGGGQDPALAATVNLSPLRFPGTPAEKLAAFPLRLANRLTRRKWALPPGQSGIARAVRQLCPAPDLVYAICYGADGLVTFEAVMRSLPARTPAILHLLDFWPHAARGFPALLRRAARRCAAIWAITGSIARYVTEATGRECLIQSGFYTRLPAAHKMKYREGGEAFKVVVIGNIWSDPLLGDLKAIWRWCQERRPNLPAIGWYCHPDGIAQLRAKGASPEPELEPRGFLSGDDFWSMLAETELALIPFSRHREPADDYERYSIPSRITELASAGVPIFALTSSNTPLGEFLSSRDIGRFEPAADTEAAGKALLALIDDRAGREAMGRRARALAEAEFGLAQFQSQLYRELSRLAFGGASSA